MAFERRFHLLGDVGLVAAQLFQIGRRLEHEHAAVPVIAARFQEAFGRGEIRLFDERGHVVGAAARLEFVAAADVAVARVRAFGRDAERDETVVRGNLRGGLRGLHEGRLVQDHVVGREHEQQGIRIAAQRDQGRGGDGGRGVAADGFEHDRRRLDADLAQLLGHEEALFVVGDDDRRDRMRNAREPQRSLLNQRPVAGEFQILLRIAAARHRPKARAAPTTQNYRMNVHSLKLRRM